MLPICAALIHYYCGYRIIIAAIALFCAALFSRESALLALTRVPNLAVGGKNMLNTSALCSVFAGM
jgi:hypothetical protein